MCIEESAPRCSTVSKFNPSSSTCVQLLHTWIHRKGEKVTQFLWLEEHGGRYVAPADAGGDGRRGGVQGTFHLPERRPGRDELYNREGYRIEKSCTHIILLGLKRCSMIPWISIIEGLYRGLLYMNIQGRYTMPDHFQYFPSQLIPSTIHPLFSVLVTC